MELEKLNNSDLFYKIKSIALGSVYWSSKVWAYHCGEVYRYAPMIKDTLFCSLFKESDIVGVYDMEAALGRRIAVEELTVCPLSVNYLLFGEPILTGSEIEKSTLLSFYKVIMDGIRRNERRAINREIKRLSNFFC